MVDEWSGLDFDEIDKFKESLEKLPDYIPLIIYNRLNINLRYIYLKDEGLFNKMRKLNYSKRMEFKESDDKVEWIIKDVKEFIKKYPEYKTIVK